jgi:predicted amidophosphoribosyltransferase
MGQRPGQRRQKPSEPNPYAGRTICLRCDQAFQSWDRRHNRLCPRCRNELLQEPSEEPRYPFRPPTHRPRNRYES